MTENKLLVTSIRSQGGSPFSTHRRIFHLTTKACFGYEYVYNVSYRQRHGPMICFFVINRERFCSKWHYSIQILIKYLLQPDDTWNNIVGESRRRFLSCNLAQGTSIGQRISYNCYYNHFVNFGGLLCGKHFYHLSPVKIDSDEPYFDPLQPPEYKIYRGKSDYLWSRTTYQV